MQHSFLLCWRGVQGKARLLLAFLALAMAASAAAQQAAQAAQAAGQAAEASQQTAQASRQMLEATENLRSDLLRSLIQKPDVFKPETRDSEVEGWLEWRHGMVNYLGTVDPGFVNDLTEVEANPTRT